MNVLIEKKDDVIIYPLRAFGYQYGGPVFIRGEGLYLFDDRGKKYLDAISGLWNVSFGYSIESINQAVAEQLKNLSYINLYSNSTPIVMQYANALIQVFNGDFTRVVYTCSGSESNECAIKIARKYHNILGSKNKNKIVIFDMSYHGTTYAAMSASGIDVSESNEYAPIVGGFLKLKTPFCAYCEPEEMEDDRKRELLENLREVFANGDEIAAVLLEPVIGSGGIIRIPNWYMDELCKYACKNNVLIIFDEVATGFGRTGELFAYMGLKVKPDIMCLSKGINNGVVPMGATLINRKVEKLFLDNNQFVGHFSTQNGNPLACASANAVLEILAKQETIEHIRFVGDYLKKKLIEKLLPLDLVRYVRGSGLMIGIDLVDRNGQPLSMSQLFSIEENLKKRGLILYPFVIDKVTGGFSLFPSYVITIQEAERIVNILFKTLSSCSF